MIITCPQCSTQYALPSGAIGTDGRRVKCSSCAHVWHQAPLEKLADISHLQPPPEKTDPLPPRGNLPALVRPAATPWLKAACVLLCLAAALTGAVAWHRQFPAVAERFAMQPTDGLTFRRFVAEKQRADNRLEFSIRGAVANESQEPKRVPDIRVTVFSRGGREMGTATIVPPERTLAPGASVTVGTEITRVSGSADTIVLDLGNPWELFFRPPARESMETAKAQGATETPAQALIGPPANPE